MQIQAATVADLPIIMELLTRAGLPINDYHEHIDKFIVATHDGSIRAAICLQRCGNHGLLRSLVVDHPYRNLGIGSSLVEDVIQTAKSNGLSLLYLLTQQSQAYFTRFGFEVIERTSAPATIQRTRQFTDLCPETAVLMQLDL